MFEEVKKSLFIIALLSCRTLLAQDTVNSHEPIHPSSPKRIYLAAGISTLGYGTGLVALSNAWYKNYPQSSFHFFNDNNDWLQVDKAGHVFSAYTASKMSEELWRWAGLSRKQRIWVSGISGTAFMTVIEVLDGFSSEWGFSMGDLAADLAGGGIFIAQELAWNEQRVQIKFSFHRNNYGDPSLNQRTNELFGSRTSERMLKDYNGQTYWASANIKSFFKNARIPSWLNIAVGYGAAGMFGGTENIARDKNGTIIFNRTDIPRTRKWYLAPDIDLTRIKTKSKFLRTTFFLLNSFKFPTPSIGFSKKGIEWSWVHF
ncbi:MAG: DUF2279 domain-containing protein [Bacteroidota bacterium]